MPARIAACSPPALDGESAARSCWRRAARCRRHSSTTRTHSASTCKGSSWSSSCGCTGGGKARTRAKACAPTCAWLNWTESAGKTSCWSAWHTSPSLSCHTCAQLPSAPWRPAGTGVVEAARCTLPRALRTAARSSARRPRNPVPPPPCVSHHAGVRQACARDAGIAKTPRPGGMRPKEGWGQGKEDRGGDGSRAPSAPAPPACCRAR